MAELIGTFALVFVSAGATIAARMMQGGQVPVLFSVGLAVALIYAAVLAVTMPISGGYLNPAFTLMLWVFKRLDGARAFALILVQMLGGVTAGIAAEEAKEPRPPGGSVLHRRKRGASAVVMALRSPMAGVLPG